MLAPMAKNTKTDAVSLQTVLADFLKENSRKKSGQSEAGEKIVLLW